MNRGDGPVPVGDHPLRALILEDSPEDAELVQRALRGDGIVADTLLASDEVAFRAALTSFVPELILADYALPGFTGVKAVEIARDWDPAVPCILVSGTLGEELAVTAIHGGATDYVLKQRLDLLAPAVRRALDEAAERRERLRLEATVVESEQRFEELFAGVDAILNYRRFDDGVSMVSPGGERILGYSAGLLAERDFWTSLVHPEDLATYLECWRRPGTGWQIEYRMHRADDAWIWVRDAATWWSKADGTPDRAFGVVTDITDRRAAVEAMRESQARLHASLNAMPDPFLIGSAVRDVQGSIVDFRIDFANRAAGVALGRDPKVLVGEALQGPWPVIGGAPFADLCRIVVDSGRRWEADPVGLRVSRRGEDVEWVVSIQIVKFVDGFLVTWRDVAERERGRAERERLASAVEQTAEAVVITDPDARILYVNPAFERVSGYSAAEAIGRNPRFLQSGVHQPPFFREMWATLLAGETWEGVLVNRRKDGGTFVETASISPIVDSSGSRTAYVGVKRDVTALREMEAGILLESNVRAVLALTLHRSSSAATAEEIATGICNGLSSLPGIDFVAVFGFAFEDWADALAYAAPAGFPPHPSQDSRLTRMMRARAIEGPWAETWPAISEDGTWGAALTGIGIQAMAYGPIIHGDHADGVLAIGTCDRTFAQTLPGCSGGGRGRGLELLARQGGKARCVLGLGRSQTLSDVIIGNRSSRLKRSGNRK